MMKGWLPAVAADLGRRIIEAGQRFRYHFLCVSSIVLTGGRVCAAAGERDTNRVAGGVKQQCPPPAYIRFEPPALNARQAASNPQTGIVYVGDCHA